jgi:hypothetical protein
MGDGDVEIDITSVSFYGPDESCPGFILFGLSELGVEQIEAEENDLKIKAKVQELQNQIYELEKGLSY